VRLVLEDYSLPLPHETKPVEVARLGLGACIPLFPPPLVPPRVVKSNTLSVNLHIWPDIRNPGATEYPDLAFFTGLSGMDRVINFIEQKSKPTYLARYPESGSYRISGSGFFLPDYPASGLEICIRYNPSIEYYINSFLSQIITLLIN